MADFQRCYFTETSKKTPQNDKHSNPLFFASSCFIFSAVGPHHPPQLQDTVAAAPTRYQWACYAPFGACGGGWFVPLFRVTSQSLGADALKTSISSRSLFLLVSIIGWLMSWTWKAKKTVGTSPIKASVYRNGWCKRCIACAHLYTYMRYLRYI